MPQKGIKVLKVEEGSAAEASGLIPGDVLLEADGHEITDELALRFHLAVGNGRLLVRRKDGTEEHLVLELSEQEASGIRVEEFKTRTCANACLFCFVDQLPPGVRPPLKIKDDDFRLSFLHGNYITMTNLNGRDMARIIEQRLSPLYVSVHATEPDLRTRILGRKRSDDLIGKIGKLVRRRITLHAQVVLMPGINDGTHLEKTVADLYSFHPGVRSISIVPLGLSDHGAPRNRLTPVTPAFCRKTVRQVSRWQERFRRETGETFAYLADEFYIQGGVELPEADCYDDFPQIEDGVGMARSFLDSFEAEWERRGKKRLDLSGVIVTGRLFHPMLRACMDRYNRKFGSRIRVRMAENAFLGKSVTVAGLLAGRDILKALKGRALGDFIVIPQEAVSGTKGVLLDDMSPRDLSAAIGKPVLLSGRTVRDFFRLLEKRSRVSAGRR